MVLYDGFEVWIEVDGHKVNEYVATDDLSKDATVTRWIASESGKNFTVNFRDTHQLTRPTTIGVYTYLDGVHVDGTFMRSERVTVTGVATSAVTERAFCFSSIDVTDDDRLLASKASSQLGQIEVRLRRISVGAPASFTSKAQMLPGDEKVHERSKKAGAHCVKYGAEVVTQQRSYTSVQYLDKEPLATVRFIYRPLELLRATGIAPLAASGAKRTRDDIDDIDHPVKVEADGILRDKSNVHSSSKNETHGRKRVKTEATSRAAKEHVFIDLT